jgi:hypothetical protein
MFTTETTTLTIAQQDALFATLSLMQEVADLAGAAKDHFHAAWELPPMPTLDDLRAGERVRPCHFLSLELSQIRSTALALLQRIDNDSRFSGGPTISTGQSAQLQLRSPALSDGTLRFWISKARRSLTDNEDPLDVSDEQAPVFQDIRARLEDIDKLVEQAANKVSVFPAAAMV